jgi:hypothetical protein
MVVDVERLARARFRPPSTTPPYRRQFPDSPRSTHSNAFISFEKTSGREVGDRIRQPQHRCWRIAFESRYAVYVIYLSISCLSTSNTECKLDADYLKLDLAHTAKEYDNLYVPTAVDRIESIARGAARSDDEYLFPVRTIGYSSQTHVQYIVKIHNSKRLRRDESVRSNVRYKISPFNGLVACSWNT